MEIVCEEAAKVKRRSYLGQLGTFRNMWVDLAQCATVIRVSQLADGEKIQTVPGQVPSHTGNRSLIHQIQQDPHLSLSVSGASRSNQSCASWVLVRKRGNTRRVSKSRVPHDDLRGSHDKPHRLDHP